MTIVRAARPNERVSDDLDFQPRAFIQLDLRQRCLTVNFSNVGNENEKSPSCPVATSGSILSTCGIGRGRLARGVERRYDITGARRSVGVGILRHVWSHFGDYFLLVSGDPINSESIFVFAGVLP